MELNEEQIVKKEKKILKWIIWGYVLCLVAIIGGVFWMTYKKENETPEPIDFTTNGGIGIETEQYAYLDIQGLTKEVTIYGDVENEYSSKNDRYYIALNEGYMYIVNLDSNTIDLLKKWQDYTYSADANAVVPEPVKIYGMTESITSELKQMILDYYNERLDEQYHLGEEDFENYFGSVLLNVRREPVDTSLQALVIFTGIFAMFIIFILHVSMAVEKVRAKKNEYEN